MSDDIKEKLDRLNVLFEDIRNSINRFLCEEIEENKLNLDHYLECRHLILSTRTANCLRNENIIYIGELIQMSHSQVLKIFNLGKRSYNEIISILNKMNLDLNSVVNNWPSKNIEKLSELAYKKNIGKDYI